MTFRAWRARTGEAAGRAGGRTLKALFPPGGGLGGRPFCEGGPQGGPGTAKGGRPRARRVRRTTAEKIIENQRGFSRLPWPRALVGRGNYEKPGFSIVFVR